MFTPIKVFGLVLTIIGILILITAKSHFGAELPLMTGLFIIFFTKEKVEDERAQQIRSRAIMISFAAGYIFEVVTTYLYSEKIIGFHLTHPRYFIIFVLALAIIIFYAGILFTGAVSKLHEKYN